MVMGESQSFVSSVSLATQYAPSDWPILLTGETGVGKEILARHIHEQSYRKNQSFIPINCAALPPGLFESELFGHERGAFSGAVQSSRGMVRAARGGTLFLDEIGELDPLLQVKLLRFLDQKEIRAVGSQRIEHIDARIISATNVDLARAVHEGRFRLDLLERLSVLTVKIPPLRERGEDISHLARALLSDLEVRWSDGALRVLHRYDWPGNIRQLKNVLVRASVLGKPRVTRAVMEKVLDDERALTDHSMAASVAEPSLAEIEKDVILQRLRYYRGNRKTTAKGLGIAKSTLQEKLRRWKEAGVSISSS